MIELQNVCRTFIVGDQQVAALRDINLRLDASEYVSIMGPSGSGKSTLLNLIGLLDRRRFSRASGIRAAGAPDAGSRFEYAGQAGGTSEARIISP